MSKRNKRKKARRSRDKVVLSGLRLDAEVVAREVCNRSEVGGARNSDSFMRHLLYIKHDGVFFSSISSIMSYDGKAKTLRDLNEGALRLILSVVWTPLKPKSPLQLLAEIDD